MADRPISAPSRSADSFAIFPPYPGIKLLIENSPICQKLSLQLRCSVQKYLIVKPNKYQLIRPRDVIAEAIPANLRVTAIAVCGSDKTRQVVLRLIQIAVGVRLGATRNIAGSIESEGSRRGDRPVALACQTEVVVHIACAGRAGEGLKRSGAGRIEPGDVVRSCRTGLDLKGILRALAVCEIHRSRA